MTPVRVDIVQKTPDEHNQHMLRTIRHSSSEEGKRWDDAVDVTLDHEAGEALRRLQLQLEKDGKLNFGILVLLGYSPQEVESLREEAEAAQIEIVCSNLDWDCEPMADMREFVNFGNEQGIGEAIRKSWLRGRLRHRLGVQWRKLKVEPQELQNYFSLRYEVYKTEKYIPLEFDSRCKWELDWTDRSSLPFGAFASNGRMIGCVRLVQERFDESEYTPEIDKLVKSRRSQILQKRWEGNGLPYPFDACQHFEGFHDYYQTLARGDGRKAELSRVIVHPEFRRQGIAEVLVDSVTGFARPRGFERLFLACQERHCGLYSRCGYKRIPGLECPEFGQFKVKAVAMDRRMNADGAQ